MRRNGPEGAMPPRAVCRRQPLDGDDNAQLYTWNEERHEANLRLAHGPVTSESEAEPAERMGVAEQIERTDRDESTEPGGDN